MTLPRYTHLAQGLGHPARLRARALIALLVGAQPFACTDEREGGENNTISDPQGCRVIHLEEDTTTTAATATGDTSTSSSGEITAPTETNAATQDQTTSTQTTATTESTSQDGASCGDGILDDGEECDDGDENADDSACTATCRTALCGDGLIWTDHEECDDDEANSGDGPASRTVRSTFAATVSSMRGKRATTETPMTGTAAALSASTPSWSSSRRSSTLAGLLAPSTPPTRPVKLSPTMQAPQAISRLAQRWRQRPRRPLRDGNAARLCR